MQIIEMKNLDHWKETIESKPLVITDFWADWCQPCKILGKTMKDIANEDDGTFKDLTVAKIDTESPEFVPLAQQLQITSIPTMMVHIKGKQIIFQTEQGQIDRIMGALPRKNLEGLFSALLQEVEKIPDGHDHDSEQEVKN